MKSLVSASLAIALVLGVSACEKPAPKEMTPEHKVCFDKAEVYFGCKMQEAGQLGEQGAKPIKRAVDANRNRARVSLEKCEAVLAKVPEDDTCRPR